ncbi:hypothetical protein Nans01_15730 [Nocardiopsis ansamitocini]|uniref:Uncharacterized protein n=1 Tax=Nocardiopsis ansamitocini TaxID=1670832 RepID=A0A9W6UI02_9ACTN|nr:hypothetical protein Nans01_15730 [Nocardiopsis ansamitocini]
MEPCQYLPGGLGPGFDEGAQLPRYPKGAPDPGVLPLAGAHLLDGDVRTGKRRGGVRPAQGSLHRDVAAAPTQYTVAEKSVDDGPRLLDGLVDSGKFCDPPKRIG